MISIASIAGALSQGRVIPYLGPGVLELVPGGSPVPASAEILAEKLTAKVSVPFKVRKNLTAAAQFIENFKHRKTVTKLLGEAFEAAVTPSGLHTFLAQQENLPLMVSAWFDNAMQTALAPYGDWGVVQGLSQAEHFGQWSGWYHADGTPATEEAAPAWRRLLYQPLGGVSPARNYLVSDSDYVEVLTEIDIQTPIPAAVQKLRAGRNFLFLGCRFRNQLERTFARQIMKRSSDLHWAVLPGELTRNEQRFLEEQNIRRLDMPLESFLSGLIAESGGTLQAAYPTTKSPGS